MKKKQYLLDMLIQAYIKADEPIGSSKLKDMFDIEYSPASIRSYFKLLADDGALVQEHISSGRVPTVYSLKQYWQDKLTFDLQDICLETTKRCATDMGITVFVKRKANDTLKKVLDIEQNYIILKFENFYILTEYNQLLYKFLISLENLTIDDILKISKDIGANRLYNKLLLKNSTDRFDIYNLKQFLKVCLKFDMPDKNIKNFLNGSVLDDTRAGLYFETILPHGYIGVCHNAKQQNEDINMLVVGELSKDYDYFYKEITI